MPVIALLAALAWRQTSHWQNSLTLWQHCVDCEPDTNDFAQNMYGVALADAGRVDEAMEHYVKAFEINPKYLTPRTNYAVNLQKENKPAEVLKVCDEALQYDPDDAASHFLKAVALHTLKRSEESIQEFRITIANDPKHVLAHNNLAEVLRIKGSYDDALVECRTALELNPDLPEGHRTLANIFLGKNHFEGAVAQFEIALKFKPDDFLSHDGLAEVLWRQGKFREAVEHLKQVVTLQPQNAPMVLKVVRELISDPRPEARFGAEALEIARSFCETIEHKDDIFALDLLAGAYAETGDFDQAEATVRRIMATPLGKKPDNVIELQKRLMLYHAHKKPLLQPPPP